jgi:hypothetical protein
MAGIEEEEEEERVAEGGDPPPLSIANRHVTTICVSKHSSRPVNVSNCSNSFVYVLTSVERVSISECQGCTLFVAESQTVIVSMCSDLSVTAVASSVEVSQSDAIRLFLHTKRSPIIGQNATRVVVAPFNAVFAGRIPEFASAWNHPRAERGSSCSIMDPADFVPFVIPFGPQPQGIAAPMPPSYQRALADREQVAEKRRQTLLDFCRRVPGCADQMQSRIATEFRSYLAQLKAGQQLSTLSRTENF